MCEPESSVPCLEGAARFEPITCGPFLDPSRKVKERTAYVSVTLSPQEGLRSP